METCSLRTFVQRVLLLRIAVAAAILCAIAAAVAWRTERRRMVDRVVDSARAGVARLVTSAADRIAQGDDPTLAVRGALARAALAPLSLDAGRFVAIEVYDASGNVIAEARSERDPGIDAVLAEEPREFPAADEFRAHSLDMGQRWHVAASAPLPGPDGRVRAWARGVFEVSNESAARTRQAAVRAALLAALVVMVVTGILYPIVRRLAVRLADHATALLDANLAMLSVLGSAIATRDSDTDAHNYRVTLYSVRLGEAVGLDDSAMQALLKGAFLHDVGKIGIPDAILLKPGKLDEKEFETMKGHVNLGVDIVSRSPWLADAVRVVGNHHEKFTGNGYPAGVAASKIPVEARIFAIADVFDALTSKRPYKKPLSLDEALAILEEGSGSHFDPALLTAFRAIATQLHGRYAGRGREHLAAEVEEIVRSRFSPRATLASA